MSVNQGRGHSFFEGAVDGIVKVSMDKSSGQPIITVAAGPMRSTAGDDRLSFRVETQELPGQDNFGNPIDTPVLRYLEDYQAAPVLRGKLIEALRMLAELYRHHREKLEADGVSPAHATVGLDEWQITMLLLAGDTGNRARLRKELKTRGLCDLE